jgi:UDP-3-O-acyl N-acetylglucosamine deacetylase
VVTGRGYWSGRECRVEFRPAPPDSGVVFVRDDLPRAASVPAWIGSVVPASHRTRLSLGGAAVELVEHVSSALAGLGIDNCTVGVTAEELPGMDGSSRAYVEAIDAAGTLEQAAPQRPWVVTAALRVGDDSAWIEAGPPRFPGLSVEYHLDYGPGPIGRQTLALDVTPEAYRREIAAARTFLSMDDAMRLRAAGLGTTVSPADLVLFGPDGPQGTTLRWPDECVRHKILDVIGDLALAGRPLHAHVRAHRSGHALNADLVRALERRTSARSA